MDKQEFQHRLEESTKKLIEFTESLVYNSISDKIEFLIEPNSREISNHLDITEQQSLQKLNQLKDKLFDQTEVINHLYNSGKVPLWINTEVYLSKKHKTTIKLICSRRLRDDNDLNHKADAFPPFHITVPLPPWRKQDEKFNINWKRQKLKKLWYTITWKWKYRRELKKTTPQHGI